MLYTGVLDMVGNTPAVRLAGSKDRPLYLKLEGANPTGSVKDRACAYMLHAAIADGRLSPGKTLLDASSGNFACALANYGKLLGYSTAVAVTSKLTPAKRDFLKYLGVTIFAVGDFTIQANQYCRDLVAREPGKYCFLDQLHNWDNPRAHSLTTGPEIFAAVPDVSVIVGSLGSGGTMAGIAEYAKRVAPATKIVTVECASGGRIPGTGTFADGDYITPFISQARERGYFDERVVITEADAALGSAMVIDEGLFCGLQTGGVVHAALRQAAIADRPGSIVAISGDNGWKNLDRLLSLSPSATRADLAHA